MMGCGPRQMMLASAIVGWSAACAAEPPPPASVAPPGWGLHAVDEQVVDMAPSGRTDSLRMRVQGRSAGTAIQVTVAGVAAEGAPCFQLENVVDGHGVELVASADNRLEWGKTCFACSQRVSVGHGFGWFVLPNDGDEHDFGDYLDLVISARECATLLPVDTSFGQAPPRHLRVRSFAVTAKPGPLALDLLVAHSADSGLGTEAKTWLARVVELAATHFGPDGIALRLRASVALELAPGPVRFGDGEQTALDEVHRAAHAAAEASELSAAPVATVVFARCLEHVGVDGRIDGVEGLATRIPGGGSDGHFADGVFVAASGCEAGVPVASPDRAAKVLAHELGHFLGLYHTVEASGAQDLLSDTDSHNLMSSLPAAADSSGLSAKQVLVMRSHPYVYSVLTLPWR